MKLTTDIKPRRDGKLTAKVPDGSVYRFEDEGDGYLVCDITNQADIEFLLDTGNFYPADGLAVGGSGDGSELGDDEDSGDGGEDSPPVEANTPPKPSAAKKPRAKPAAKKADKE